MNVMGDVIFEEGGGTHVGGGFRFFSELCSPSAGEVSAQQGGGQAVAAKQQQRWQRFFSFYR